MHCSLGTSPGSDEEAVCFVSTFESHVPKEDVSSNVDKKTGVDRMTVIPHLLAGTDCAFGHHLRQSLESVALR